MGIQGSEAAMSLLVEPNWMLLVAGAACGVLVASGVAWALWYSRSLRTRTTARDISPHQTLATVNRLARWAAGMADQMSRYGAVVDGLSRLFRDRRTPITPGQREATGALLAQVVEANTTLHQRLGHARNMLEKQASELSVYMSEARTDTLTGLPNRRAYEEELERRLSEWKRRRVPLSVLMVDIDRFKQVNDTHGHQAGDAILKEVADTLCRAVRQADLVGRLGGEEIAVLLPNTDEHEARIAAHRCRVAIERSRCSFQGKTLRVTASFGAACCLRNETGEQLMRRTDEAMYAAKENGRNRAFWHDGVQAVPIVLDEASADSWDPTAASTEVPQLPDEDEFVQVCEDLRRRLAEVTGHSS